MGCGICCSKAALIICNIISMLLGLVLMTAGCILKFGQSIITGLLSSLNLPENVELDLDFLFGGVAISLLVIGAVVFLLSIFGCCGASCDSRCMLILYAIVVSTILIAELVCVILVVAMKEQLDTFLTSQLNTTLVDSYKGFKSMDAISLAWNIIQLEMKCCGVENYTDFNMAKNWNRTLTVASQNIVMKLPVTCCKNISLSEIQSIDLRTVGDCLTAPTIENANIGMGCYRAVEKVIGEQSGITIGVTCSVLVLQLILVILACCVCKAKKDNDDDLNKVYPN